MQYFLGDISFHIIARMIRLAVQLSNDRSARLPGYAATYLQQVQMLKMWYGPQYEGVDIL